MQPIPTVDVNTWEEFEEKLIELGEQTNSERSDALPMLFRGQENSDWGLTTTLERRNQHRTPFADYFRRISRMRTEIESFSGKEWMIPEYPEVLRLSKEFDEFSLKQTSGRLPAYDYMAYLRHHSFPSPLLDWSRSLRVAAYFAFSGAIGIDRIKDQKVSIYTFLTDRFTGGSSDKPLVLRLGPYVRTHRRHFLQRCEYTMCVRFENEWRFATYQEVFDCPTLHQGKFRKFNIPATEGPKVLRLLDEYNLNASSLFGSEEGLMKTLSFREFGF